MSSVTLVVGETGSGKSTKLPELLLKQGKYTNFDKGIAITLPRRLSVLNICERLARNVATEVGQ
jgi:HrpA-like RNA helicase